MDPAIILNLRLYQTRKAMWNYIKEVYHPNSFARRFQLEYELANYTQGNLSIQQFYSTFINVWTEYTDIVYSSIPNASLLAIQNVHQTSQRDQFLMKLWYEFKDVRSNLMTQIPSPSLDTCLNELLCEEQRLSTQVTLEQQESSSNVLNVAYAAQGKQKGWDMTNIQCYSWEFGHIATQCQIFFCKYYNGPYALFLNVGNDHKIAILKFSIPLWKNQFLNLWLQPPHPWPPSLQLLCSHQRLFNKWSSLLFLSWSHR